MMDYLGFMALAGLYFVYIAHFHSILPEHHGVLRKSLVSHSVIAVALGLMFFLSKP